MAKPWHRWPPELRSPDGPARLAIYARDNWKCAINFPGCTIQPTDLDHIVPPFQGGAWFDSHNLRAACSKCNGARSNPRSRHNRTPPVEPTKLW